MPSPRERTRNNIRMGVFVSVTLVLALFVVSALTDAVGRFTSRMERYSVEFTLRSGVNNLKPGSEVRVGGVKLGEVTEVRPRFGPEFEHIDVQFKLDHRVRLFSNARIHVTTPLIGAEAWLDIPSVGDPATGPPPGNHLAGAERGGALAALLGPQADEIVENARVFAEFLGGMPGEYERRVVPVLANVALMTEDAQQLVAQLRHEDWPQWKAAVDELIGWADRATRSLDALTAEGHGLLADARGVIGENRERVERALENLAVASEDVQQLVAWANDEGRERIIAVLEAGGGALDHAREALATLRRDYDRWATDFGFVMANANLASQQLRLATTEIRRAPWKLMHRPGVQELEHELLYDTVRAFAIAAADLKSASVSFQRVLENHGEQIAGDDEAMERLKRNLVEPLDRYEEAQRRLLNVLTER